jgi:hypothetical protein
VLQAGADLVDTEGWDALSLAHGFVSLELAGGFGLPIDLDESYRTLMDLLVRGLERLSAG